MKEIKKIKIQPGRTIMLKAIEKNYEKVIETGMSRDNGEFLVGSNNGLLTIKRMK